MVLGLVSLAHLEFWNLMDPTAVAALTAIYERGEIRVQRPTPMAAAATAAATPAAPATATEAVKPEIPPDPASAVQASRV